MFRVPIEGNGRVVSQRVTSRVATSPFLAMPSAYLLPNEARLTRLGELGALTRTRPKAAILPRPPRSESESQLAINSVTNK